MVTKLVGRAGPWEMLRRTHLRRWATRPAAQMWVIGCLALALRLIGLDRKSIWFDEAMSAQFASLNPSVMLTAMSNDVNPPLYYLVLHYWLVFGHGDWWMRLPSALFGSAAVLLTVLLGRELLGWRVGLVAGWFTAIAPFHIDMSQEARAYGLLFLLAIGSLLLFYRALNRGGPRRWVAFAVVTALAVYTHNYALFLVVAEAIYCGLSMSLRRTWSWQPCGAFALVVILCLPWLPVLLAQIGLVKGDYWIERPYDSVLWDTYRAFISYSPPDHGLGTDLLPKIGRWLIIGLLCIGLASGISRPQTFLPALAVLTSVTAGLLISLWVTPMYVIRYIAFVVPCFWIVAARGIDILPGRLVRGVLLAAVTVSVAVNLPPLYADSGRVPGSV